jgi:hypothetical protein
MLSRGDIILKKTGWCEQVKSLAEGAAKILENHIAKKIFFENEGLHFQTKTQTKHISYFKTAVETERKRGKQTST